MNIAVFRITYIREKENNRMFRIGIAEDDPSFQKTISEYIERYQKEKNIDIQASFFQDGNELVFKLSLIHI